MSKVTLSEFIISVVELVEAQFDEMRYKIHCSAKSVFAMMLTTLLIFVALVFCLLGIRVWVEFYYGEIASYFITAFITLIITLFVAKVASWKNKQRKL